MTTNDAATITLHDAEKLARDLMRQHGVGHLPFAFDRATKRLGVTYFDRLTGLPTKITLSRLITTHSTREMVEQTMLHEIAHAIVGHAHGHNATWLAKARELGYTGGRLAPMPKGAVENLPWVGVCPAGHTVNRGRQPKRAMSCGKCSRSFSLDHLLRWMTRSDWALAQAGIELRDVPAPTAAPAPSAGHTGPHATCYEKGLHPATPAGRAACRKARR